MTICLSNTNIQLTELKPLICFLYYAWAFLFLGHKEMSPLPAHNNVKPFRDYQDLRQLLESRGMDIADSQRVERKLSQIGYYRLSGFWYPCREIEFDAAGDAVMTGVNGTPKRKDTFLPGTSFENAFALYLYDKKLRELMLNAIERIEVHIRSLIAHEVGRYNPLAYTDVNFINGRNARNFHDRNGMQRNIWQEWTSNQCHKISKSKEEHINWHLQNNKDIPFWVAIEVWDFGLMSKYFEILKGSYQNLICMKLGVIDKNGRPDPNILKNWLQEINILRNRCAHHSRIWNQNTNNPLRFLNVPCFSAIAASNEAKRKLFGLISIIWFLVQKIGPSSKWIDDVADIVDEKPDLPGCGYSSMGIIGYHKFPRHFFSI